MTFTDLNDAETFDLALELWFAGDAETLDAAAALAFDMQAVLADVAYDWDVDTACLAIAARDTEALVHYIW